MATVACCMQALGLPSIETQNMTICEEDGPQKEYLNHTCTKVLVVQGNVRVTPSFGPTCCNIQLNQLMVHGKQQPLPGHVERNSHNIL